MSYTIAEAADLLQVSPLTLRNWLAEADINPEPSPSDKRSRVLSREQLERLARQHRREVILPHGSGVQDAGEIRSISELQRYVASLERRLASHDDATKTMQVLVFMLRDECKRQNDDINVLKQQTGALTGALRELQDRFNGL